jgi:hypothetical protein
MHERSSHQQGRLQRVAIAEIRRKEHPQLQQDYHPDVMDERQSPIGTETDEKNK